MVAELVRSQHQLTYQQPRARGRQRARTPLPSQREMQPAAHEELALRGVRRQRIAGARLPVERLAEGGGVAERLGDAGGGRAEFPWGAV